MKLDANVATLTIENNMDNAKLRTTMVVLTDAEIMVLFFVEYPPNKIPIIGISIKRKNKSKLTSDSTGIYLLLYGIIPHIAKIGIINSIGSIFWHEYFGDLKISCSKSVVEKEKFPLFKNFERLRSKTIKSEALT